MLKGDKTGIAAEAWSFIPDYTLVGTSEYAEKELQGFRFRGCGWYITTTDTLLVLPYSEGKDGERDLYRFCIYNDRGPMNAFTWICSAQIRLDQR